MGKLKTCYVDLVLKQGRDRLCSPRFGMPYRGAGFGAFSPILTDGREEEQEMQVARGFKLVLCLETCFDKSVKGGMGKLCLPVRLYRARRQAIACPWRPKTRSEVVERALARVLGLALLWLGGCAAAGPSPREAIPLVLERQASAWNRGDIEAFMGPYWHSQELTFVSGGKVTKGWQETLESYHERYPTAAAMGRLAFRDLEVRELGRQTALVLGRWDLDREPPAEDVGGRFTLLFERMGRKWLIVYDHTSRD